MRNKTRVVITGIGPVSAAGIGRDDLWTNLVQQKINFEKINFKVSNSVSDDFFAFKIKSRETLNSNIPQEALRDILSWEEGDCAEEIYYFLAAIKLALQDSGLVYDFRKNAIGLVLTAESLGYGDFYIKFLEKAFNFFISSNKGELPNKRDFYNKFYQDFKKKAYDLQTFMPLFHVCKAFKIHGFSQYINNACASGLYALDIGVNLIASGQCSSVVVAGAECPDIFKHKWFKELKMYPSDGKIRPFNQDASGFILGEGAAAFILEEYNSAKRRKAFIYAEYVGGSFNQEGWKVCFPAVHEEYYRDVIVRVLKDNNFEYADIDLIVPHGAGSKVSDQFEAKVLNSLQSRKRLPAVTAFKPYIGHTLGACTLLESAIALMCLSENTILPTLNCQTPIKDCKFEIIREKRKMKFNSILKTCCAFAGFNAACLFKRIE